MATKVNNKQKYAFVTGFLWTSLFAKMNDHKANRVRVAIIKALILQTFDYKLDSHKMSKLITGGLA